MQFIWEVITGNTGRGVRKEAEEIRQPVKGV